MGKSENEIIISDTKFEDFNQYIPCENPNGSRAQKLPLIKRYDQDGFLFHTNRSNIIYNIGQHGVKPQYSIDFTKHELPKKEFYEKNPKVNSLLRSINETEMIWGYLFYIFEDKKFISYVANKQQYVYYQEGDKNG